MSLASFEQGLPQLLERAAELRNLAPQAKPEAVTRDRLLTPFLELLGYGPDERTPEAAVRSIRMSREWVDEFLLSEARRPPWMMVEAKSLWSDGIWDASRDQVLGYLQGYALDVGNEQPIPWLLLTNFREWHVLRLNDQDPFWSFTSTDLADPSFAAEVYRRLGREHVPQERLLAFYQEHARSSLGPAFLQDLKLWRLLLANGLRIAQPELSIEELRDASHALLLRLLFVRLLENYGQEPYNVLGRLFTMWRTTFRHQPFMEQLRSKFADTWASYNTELFSPNPALDSLEIPDDFLEVLVLMNPSATDRVRNVGGLGLFGPRSLYNYDFTTMSQDILGTAYEQFLAHELFEDDGVVRIRENAQTRKREGVYYTPEHIVRFIVRSALEPRVSPVVTQSLEALKAGDFDEAYEVVMGLLEIRVLDPACGSGSFLLEAFSYLTSALERYNRAAHAAYTEMWKGGEGGLFRGGNSGPQPKQVEFPHEQVLVNCIYGVDVDLQAVGLAKLSLWTRLLQSHPSQYGRRGQPHAQLPALTLNIRHGNSLIDPLDVEPGALRGAEEALLVAARATKAAKDVQAELGARREAIEGAEDARRAVREAAIASVAPYFASDADLVKLLESIGVTNVEDIDAARTFLLTGSLSRTLSEIDRDQRDDLRAWLVEYGPAIERAALMKPFAWGVEFPDVYFDVPSEKRGFSVVIGNPPYYNVDATFGHGSPMIDWLRAAFPEIHTDKTDILFYFFGRGLKALTQGGALAFIVSRSFLQGDKSRKLRQVLASDTTLMRIVDFLGHRVFGAAIATAIVHWEKAAPMSAHEVQVDFVMDYEAVRADMQRSGRLEEGVVHVAAPQESLGEDRWLLSPYHDLFRRLDERGVQLRNWPQVDYLEQGIQTGDNDVFSEDLPEGWEVDGQFIRPRVHNSDIHPFGIDRGTGRVLHFGSQVALDDLPTHIREYLEANGQALRSRAAVREGSCEWYGLQRPRDHGGVGHFRPKLLAPYRARSNRFVVDSSGELAGLTDTTIIYAKDDDLGALYALSAILNSEVLNFRYRALGGVGKLTGPGMFEYFENQVGDLVLPQLESSQLSEFAELGRQAHAHFSRVRDVVLAMSNAVSGQLHTTAPIWEFVDPAGQYRDLATYSGTEPNRIGHLLSLAVVPSREGFRLQGEITSEDDWRHGDREWSAIVDVRVESWVLREFLLFGALWLTEFDESFRKRHKLSQGEQGNLLQAALRALTVPAFDRDPVRNLRIMETVLRGVGLDADSGLHAATIALRAVTNGIDDLAYRAYGLEESREEIAEALRLIS